VYDWLGHRQFRLIDATSIAALSRLERRDYRMSGVIEAKNGFISQTWHAV
jgi:hypothetical protein